MRPNFSQARLARRKLDHTGEQWRQAASIVKQLPKGGWIRAIREALVMPQDELGRRLGVGASSVGKLEASERKRTIQLETLMRAADALDCDVVYALVPRKPLQSTVDERRLEVFSKVFDRTEHHMRLEGQAINDPNWRKNLLREAEEEIPDTELWSRRLDGDA